MDLIRPYLPAIGAFLFGLLCIKWPGLAVFLVAGAAFTFAFIYAAFVNKIQKIKRMRKQQGEQFRQQSSGGWYSADNLSNVDERSFTNVTTMIFRNGRWIKSED